MALYAQKGGGHGQLCIKGWMFLYPAIALLCHIKPGRNIGICFLNKLIFNFAFIIQKEIFSVIGCTGYTRYTRYKGYTRYTGYTGCTGCTGYTGYTGYTRYTRYKGYTRYTRYKTIFITTEQQFRHTCCACVACGGRVCVCEFSCDIKLYIEYRMSRVLVYKSICELYTAERIS